MGTPQPMSLKSNIIKGLAITASIIVIIAAGIVAAILISKQNITSSNNPITSAPISQPTSITISAPVNPAPINPSPIVTADNRVVSYEDKLYLVKGDKLQLLPTRAPINKFALSSDNTKVAYSTYVMRPFTRDNETYNYQFANQLYLYDLVAKTNKLIDEIPDKNKGQVSDYISLSGGNGGFDNSITAITFSPWSNEVWFTAGPNFIAVDPTTTTTKTLLVSKDRWVEKIEFSDSNNVLISRTSWVDSTNASAFRYSQADKKLTEIPQLSTFFNETWTNTNANGYLCSVSGQQALLIVVTSDQFSKQFDYKFISLNLNTNKKQTMLSFRSNKSDQAWCDSKGYVYEHRVSKLNIYRFSEKELLKKQGEYPLKNGLNFQRIQLYNSKSGYLLDNTGSLIDTKNLIVSKPSNLKDRYIYVDINNGKYAAIKTYGSSKILHILDLTTGSYVKLK